jgi:hypothetical protein
MKNPRLIVLVLGLMGTVLAFAQEATFKKIADNAAVGNGSATVETYDLRLDKAELVAQGLKELKKEYWENCGPWKTFNTRRASIAVIDKIESDQQESGTASELQKLYDQKKIVAIVGARSNNEIECSLFWFNVYGADGTVLKLRYNLGD